MALETCIYLNFMCVQFNRTPLHLCVCLKDRHHIWPILQDGGADQNLVDVVGTHSLYANNCLLKCC